MKKHKRRTVVITVEDGRADVESKPRDVTVELLDYDTEGATMNWLCTCDLGRDKAHYHQTYVGKSSANRTCKKGRTLFAAK